MIWKQRITRALYLSRKQAESRYFQFATVNAALQVQNRTVVFRGFAETAPTLYFVTDSNSEKYRALATHSQAEIAWYFSKTREQYRFTVNCECIDAASDEALQSLRTTYWQRLSNRAQTQFVLDSLDPQTASEVHKTPSDNFVLVSCHIYAVDYLHLGDTQQRFQYTAPDWQETPIAL
jgi:PPOX class probable FMN-dependent enzyme